MREYTSICFLKIEAKQAKRDCKIEAKQAKRDCKIEVKQAKGIVKSKQNKRIVKYMREYAYINVNMRIYVYFYEEIPIIKIKYMK